MTGISPPILAFGLPGHGEWIILLILGLLIFGRRMPDVARSIGRSIVEFKRGIRSVDFGWRSIGRDMLQSLNESRSRHATIRHVLVLHPTEGEELVAGGCA